MQIINVSFPLAPSQDLEQLAKHLNDLGGRKDSGSPAGASKHTESDDEDEGPVRDDGTLPAPDVAPL